jgi:hypothetical protein
MKKRWSRYRLPLAIGLLTKYHSKATADGALERIAINTPFNY